MKPYLFASTILCACFLIQVACTEVDVQKQLPTLSAVVNNEFPPEPGEAGNFLSLNRTVEECGVSIRGFFWQVENHDGRDITFHVQVDSNEEPKFYPNWSTFTVPARTTIKIPLCEKGPNGSQSFYFSIGGGGFGNSPLWPKPEGIMAMHAAYIIRSRGITWLINRHHKRPIIVQYQLVGNDGRNTLRLEPKEYIPIGTREAVIYAANYS
ncbi:MAG: hypothetical protein ABI980_06850 [Nitrospirota bacterium]